MVNLLGSNWEEFLKYSRMKEKAITLLTQSSVQTLTLWSLVKKKKKAQFSDVLLQMLKIAIRKL
jgi:hypothetical protein